MTEFEAFNRQKACRYGQMLYNKNDMYIGRSLDLYGEYCEGEVELFRQIVRPGQVVVEAGANIGTHTVFLAQQCGPTGGVIAFEPQRVVFQTLCANLALNSVTNTICLQQALGAEPGTILVPMLNFLREENFGGLALGSYHEGEPVPVVTLDGLNIERCHFIKVDVEGMELQVLQGGAGLIQRTLPALYVENDRKDKSAELVRYLDRLEYNMYWHITTYFNPNNFFRNSENVFGQTVAFNMLCLHKSRPQNLQGFERVEVPPA